MSSSPFSELPRKSLTAPLLLWSVCFVRKLGSGELIGLAKVRVGSEVEGLQTCAFCSNTVNVAAAHDSKQAKGLCDCQRLHQEVVSARPGSTLER